MSASIYSALQRFGQDVTAKLSQVTAGAEEDQLRGPFENLMRDVAAVWGWQIVCTGETPLPDRIGRPDFAVHLNQLLAGYVELKAPGFGVNPRRFRGHNRDQFKRFSAIPNILYTDGNEWALYRNGELVGQIVRLSGSVAQDGNQAANVQDARNVENLLRDFLSWKPVIPTDRNGKIHLKSFAEMLAPLCRMLRNEVTDALSDPSSPLVTLARDWRQLLFPDASDEQFADAYAQTVTFALLLGRSEGADPLTLQEAVNRLGIQHNLLSRALQVLTDPQVRAEINAAVNLLVRIVAAVPPALFVGPEDPWLYFYEDFLAAYDPDLRRDVGAYYTPIQVVYAQVRLVEELLMKRLGKPKGFADSDVLTLDPAVGTGTYLLGVIEHSLKRIATTQGAGAVPGQATALGRNLYGFELMVGPYAVSELRVSRALRDRGGSLPPRGMRIYLTDTLESPHAIPPQMPIYLKPIADQHTEALRVKKDVPIIVCLGNPPYDRHEAASDNNKARTGGWVRWGDDGQGRQIIHDENGATVSLPAILRDFLDPVLAAGHGVHAKNLYNLYIYFWRWALWKTFEQTSASGQGIVSFITAASYLDGDAFRGMREHMRRLCDEIWIIDLGGEGRGTRQDDNVFAIQTPVAIAIAMRAGQKDTTTPAKVHYSRIEGDRQQKLDALESIADFNSLRWQPCPDDLSAPFRPDGNSDYFAWPLLTDLMPWQHSGVQLKRTWPVAQDVDTLRRRWRKLLSDNNRSALFRETDDRQINKTYKVDLQGNSDSRPIARLMPNSPMPQAVRYAYRSFDRQWVIADGRLMSRPRPDLWSTFSDRQVYLSSLFSQPLGAGPAVTVSALLPDLDHFRGSYGAKAAMPLYRTSDALDANILPHLLELLSYTFGHTVSPEAVLSYIYGALAQSAFTKRFFKELTTRELRVPLTKDAALFEQVRQIGARLLWLHTYGERFVPAGHIPGEIPTGQAHCTVAVPESPAHYPETFDYNEATQTLHVGDGEFAPVAPDVYAFEVSGLRVVHSWLRYRMKAPSGRRSSPLDDINPERWTSQFTTELLELLWVLEGTVAGYPEQARLLEAVIAGECFQADELPAPTDEMRKPPKATNDLQARLLE